MTVARLAVVLGLGNDSGAPQGYPGLLSLTDHWHIDCTAATANNTEVLTYKQKSAKEEMGELAQIRRQLCM